MLKNYCRFVRFVKYCCNFLLLWAARGLAGLLNRGLESEVDGTKMLLLSQLSVYLFSFYLLTSQVIDCSAWGGVETNTAVGLLN